MNIITQYFKNLWTENRHWIDLGISWFSLSILIGIVTFFINPELLDKILQMFADKFGESPALDFNLAMEIFKQNVVASLIAFFGGLLVGLGSILVLAVNGFILGYILTSIFTLPETNPLQNLLLVSAGLVPHGILELPAFILAASLGLKIGLGYLHHEAKGERGMVFRRDFVSTLKYLPLVIVLLFIAGIVEVFVSGKLVGN